jgi:thiamine-monophosphate kinase
MAPQQLLLTTDVLVENVDFDRNYATGHDVGWKTFAANVSDIAAMGGRPRRAVATLSLPSSTTVAFVDEILDGLLAASERWGAGVVGGDVSEADQISVGVALIGNAEHPVLRSGANPGDAICVTGALGGAAGGLLALRSDIEGAVELKRRQLRPVARVEEGVAAAAAGATAMIDISDGFARDLGHLVAASGVGCEVEIDSIPVDPALSEVSELIFPMEAALAGGEDFELLLTIREDSLTNLFTELNEIGTGVTRVGTITDGEARLGSASLEQWKERGWEHLRTR